MEKRYLLPITLLLASTKGVHQILFFQARLPAQRISLEECVVQLSVCDGATLSCEIKETARGSILFQQEQAIDILKPLGMLEWSSVPAPAYHREEIHEQLPMVGQDGSPPESDARQIPVRRRPNADVPSLDHSYRRIFLLIDGTRSVGQIAKLLGKDPEEILKMLRNLEIHNFITLRHS